MKRLTIVVPYRDRADHLNQFVPHLRAYFARDKLDCTLDYRVLIVEQEPGTPFNRGALRNIGFMLTSSDSDYTCFHDVDYLPVWADYSWTDIPKQIIWHGMEEIPISPASSMVISHNIADLFSAVVLIPNHLFRNANGYPNCYWGWGFEDMELKSRFLAQSIELGHRKGTYIPLLHENEGYDLQGGRRPIANINGEIFRRRVERGELFDNGLSTINYQLKRRAIIDDPKPERSAVWEIATVSIGGRPSQEQQAALS
jgi:hypothetical protein